MSGGRSPRPFWRRPLLATAALAALWLGLPPLLGLRGVYLATDVLLFVLLSGVLLLAAWMRRRRHLREPWLRVFHQKRAAVSAVVLAAFTFIGLADSIHFRKPLPPAPGAAETAWSVEVLSVLDVLLAHLREREEQTYSAPLATRLYVRQPVERGGRQVREYPRLRHGGAHLTDPDREWAGDVARLALAGAGGGLALAVLAALGLMLLLARARGEPLARTAAGVWRGEGPVPWRTVLATVAVVCAVAGVLAGLSVHYHVLGTDKVGTDVLYLSLKSVRTGLVIGTLTTLVMLPFAILLGIMAGYFRGWVDDVIQYLYTTLNSIPGVLLIAAAILSIQVYIENHPQLFETATDRADLRLLALCVILGITSWTGLCRLLRGETLKVRELDYIQAAVAFGVRPFVILGRHVLPNVMHIVLIIVVLDFSGLVLAEAVLSYVGVGVDPATISWGNMINGARLELAREPPVWWSLVAAFCFMFALVLSANLFADAVRDAFDPRLREQPA